MTDEVLLVHWGRKGGGPRFLLELARSFVAEGEPVAVSFNAEAEVADELRSLRSTFTEVRTYRSRWGVLAGLPRLVGTAWRFRRRLRRNKVRTVVCVMESIYQSIALPLVVPRSVRYVVCVHDASLHPGDEHPVKLIGKRLEMWRADALLTMSSVVADALERAGRTAGKQVIRSAHPAYGAGAAPTNPRRLPGDRPVVVGFFGRLLPYKGVHLLAEAAELLRADGLRVEFRVFGEGPEGEGHQGREGALEWHVGWVSEADVARVVGGFDVLVLPYVEASQSGVLAQAVSLGVPSVVTPVGGLVEQAAQSGAAVVSEDTSARAIAEAIRQLVTDGELYARLSSAALGAAADRLSWHRLESDIQAASRVEAAPAPRVRAGAGRRS